MGKKSNFYSREFKLRVVGEVISGRYTKNEARQVYGIRSNSAILYWMRKFCGNDDYRHNFTDAQKQLEQMPQMPQQVLLEQKVAALQQELRLANLRADLLTTMIEVAEKQLGIDIKKKYGAQLSKLSEPEAKGSR